MKTREIPAQAYVVLCECPKCEVGDLRRTDANMLFSEPPKYQHKCTSCDHEEYLTEIYPQTRMRWEGE